MAEQSTDGGANYSDMVEVRNGAIMGTLVNAVPSASPYYLDTTNKLTVQLDMTDNSVEIDSLTDQQFYSEGGGFALVDADGSFEIGQYRDAVDLGDGLYEFTTLMRGRLNTGAADHASGARFILLETVAATVAPTSQIGVDMYYRATSFGRSPSWGPSSTAYSKETRSGSGRWRIYSCPGLMPTPCGRLPSAASLRD